MANTLTIEIQDSKGVPRCSVLWYMHGKDYSLYALRLAYGIGRLNDDSTTEEIVNAIQEEFPSSGIYLSSSYYIHIGADSEMDITLQFAEDFGFSSGDKLDGAIVVTRMAILRSHHESDYVLYLTLGGVSLADCVVKEELREYCGMAYAEEGSTGYHYGELWKEKIERTARPMGVGLLAPITTRKQWEECLEIINHNEWLEWIGEYYHVGNETAWQPHSPYYNVLPF